MVEEKIDVEEAAKLWAALKETELATYRGRCVELEIRVKYGMRPDDKIELPSGRIKRAPMPQPSGGADGPA